ncbi:MAG: putative Ig domain-containing protein [Bryobacterales bacterium]|nr:putative Ig domain-containing protein [Bryobacterales bacterium]
MMRRMMPLVLGALLVMPCFGQIRNNAGFNTNSIPANDDGSAPATTLGFTINFFGRQRNVVFVNNNGNVTFDSALATFTPFGLNNVSREIIAPFFADVDTRNPASRLVTYGNDTVNGRPAFGVNWVDVGYYNAKADKTNSFQLVLIHREDTGPGNFDIEFNYSRITWETGDASSGTNGLGGVSASAGWSNGSGLAGTSYQLPGSLIPGSFLDFGPYSLSRGRTPGASSGQSGRWVFRGREGAILEALTMLTGCPIPNAASGQPYNFRFSASGSRPPYRWALVADPEFPNPGLAMSSAGVLSGTLNTPGEYPFTVRVEATDEGEVVSVTRRCQITVDPPVISFRTNAQLPPAAVNTRYEARLAAQGGAGPFRYATVSGGVPGLQLNADGVLAGSPTEPGSWPVLIAARSDVQGAVPARKQFLVNVQPADLQLRSSCPLPNATGGVPYTARLEARGGFGPYRFKPVGQLPPGLVLQPNGVLEGQPTTPNWWPFEMEIEDMHGKTARAGCGLVVLYPEIRVSSACPLPEATSGAAYSQTLSAAGGAGPYTWSVVGGSLPMGLRLSSTGALTGTPLTPGNASFRLKVTDSRGQTAAAGCNVAVRQGSYALGSCPLPDAVAGEPYAHRIFATGGAEPYRFAEAQPLPGGLRISADGSLSGTLATAGTFPVALRVTDAAGRVTTRSCDLKVQPQALRLTNACPLPSGDLGVAYSTKLTAAGGVEPYTFSSGALLPPGLRLGTDGTLAGTPSAAGYLGLLITVADRGNQRTTQLCELPVELPAFPDLKVTGLPASLAPATAGPRVSAELAAPYQLPVEADLVIEVEPETGQPSPEVNRADPRLRFSTGQRVLPVTIAAGQRVASPAAQIVNTGTVASKVTVKVTNVRAAGIPFGKEASAVARVPRLAPVLTNVCYIPGTGGFDVEVTGYSTTRELVSADLTFGQNTYFVRLTDASQEFFSTEDAARNGGTFRVRANYRLSQANPQTLGQGTAVVRNTVGAAASRPIARCQ